MKELQKNLRALHSSSKIVKIPFPFENIQAALNPQLPLLEKKHSAILTINPEADEGNAVIFTTDPQRTSKCVSEIKKIVEKWKWNQAIHCDSLIQMNCYEQYLKNWEYERKANSLTLFSRERLKLQELRNSLPNLQHSSFQYEAYIFEQLLSNRNLHEWLETDLNLWSLHINYYTYQFTLESYLPDVLETKCEEFAAFVASLIIKIRLNSALQINPLLLSMKQNANHSSLTQEESELLSHVTYDEEGTAYVKTSLSQKDTEMCKIAEMLDRFTNDLPTLTDRELAILELENISVIRSCPAYLIRKAQLQQFNKALQEHQQPVFFRKVRNPSIWSSLLQLQKPRLLTTLGGVFEIKDGNLAVFGNQSIVSLISIVHSILEKGLSLINLQCEVQTQSQILSYYEAGWFKTDIQLFKLPSISSSLFCYPSTPTNQQFLESLLRKHRPNIYSLLPEYLLKSIVKQEAEQSQPLIAYLAKKKEIWLVQDNNDDDLFWRLADEQTELEQTYKQEQHSQIEYSDCVYLRTKSCFEIAFKNELAFNYEALLGHTLQFKTFGLKNKPTLSSKEKKWLWRTYSAVIEGKWINMLSLPQKFNNKEVEKQQVQKVKKLLELRALYPEAWNVLAQLEADLEYQRVKLNRQQSQEFFSFLKNLKIFSIPENAEEELKSSMSLEECERVQSLSRGKGLDLQNYEYKCAKLPDGYLADWGDSKWTKPLIFLSDDECLESRSCYVICRVGQSIEQPPYPEYTFIYK